MEISTFCQSHNKFKRLKKLFLVMKLTTLLIILGCLHLSAAVYSQNIKLSEKSISLENAFSKIQKQSGYTFFYKIELIKDIPEISIDINHATIEQALDKCLKDLPLSYFIVGKIVVIKPRDEQAPSSSAIENKIIAGKITDEHNNPMLGVTVSVKEFKRATVSNEKGEYIITAATENTLIFSFIGYKTQEIKVGDQAVKIGDFTRINVVMKEDISQLDQIQIVAYGTTTKRLNTGDQTTVTAKQIENYPVANVLDVLQGSVPGLFITKSSGNPGATYDVNIRGRNGINTGTSPLYVIDGVPYQGGSYTSQNTTLSNHLQTGYDALSFINPQDIESINVLKDADATAIYGSRAANGVILITTKKGKPGATKVDVNVSSGISKVTRFPNFLNTQQYLQMRKEAKANDKSAVLPSDYDLNGTWDTTRYTNWSKLLLDGTGHTTNAQATISGGNSNTQYLISGNYRDQTNVQSLIGGGDQTGSLHFNLNNTSTDNKFYVALTGGYMYDHNTIPAVDLTSSLASLPPDAPSLFNSDGTLNFQNNTFSNPLIVRNLLATTTANNLMSSLLLSYKLLKNLELKATLGYNRQELNEFLGTPTTSFLPSQNVTSGFSNFTKDINSTWSIEPQIDYKAKLSKGLLNVTVGSSLQKQTTEINPLIAKGYSSNLLLSDITAGTSITPGINGYGYSNYKFDAIFGRVNYNWDNKYIINATGRYDGSSKFGPNRQFHFFGAGGAAWIFTQEDFFKNNLSFLSFGKLRGSYGVTGNDQVGNYTYLEGYATTIYPYQGVPGLYPSRIPNPNLSWEQTAKAEIGLELQFLKGRIAVESNYFKNTTTAILAAAPLSTVTGFTSINENLPGKVQNKGYDITLTTVNVHSTDFNWTTNITFSRQFNKLLAYPNLAPAQQYILNQSLGVIKVFRFAGVNPQTGIYQFYAKNGGLTSSPTQGIDDTGLENINPNFFGAVQNSISYKGFTLDFLFRYVKQIGHNAFGQGSILPPGFSALNETTSVLARWQKPGDITDVQRYGTSFALFFPYNDALISDHAYGDASYIRLQNLSLGYRFNPSVVQKLHLQGLRVYVEGENLLTISKYGDYDPENQSGQRLPPLRFFTTGLQVTL